AEFAERPVFEEQEIDSASLCGVRVDVLPFAEGVGQSSAGAVSDVDGLRFFVLSDHQVIPLACDGGSLFRLAVPDALLQLLGIITESASQEHHRPLRNTGGDLRAAKVDDWSREAGRISRKAQAALGSSVAVGIPVRNAKHTRTGHAGSTGDHDVVADCGCSTSA